MDTERTASAPETPSAARLAPNHHADHPGFSGASGLVAAVSFLRGRDHQAELAIEQIRLRSGDRLVDIGCGPGVAARRAAARGAAVIGVDPAPVMLAVARRFRNHGIDWQLGTAESLPVPDRWATVVWSLATVHHWKDIGRGLEETVRVLRPGGRMIVVERLISPDASGHASHGWSPAQAESFAASCIEHGLIDVRTERHTTGSTLLSVDAVKAP